MRQCGGVSLMASASNDNPSGSPVIQNLAASFDAGTLALPKLCPTRGIEAGSKTAKSSVTDETEPPLESADL